MGLLAMLSDGFVEQQAQAAMGDLDAELDRLLNGE